MKSSKEKLAFTRKIAEQKNGSVSAREATFQSFFQFCESDEPSQREEIACVSSEVLCCQLPSPPSSLSPSSLIPLPASSPRLPPIPTHLAVVHFVILRGLHFFLCFRFLLIHATVFPVTLHSQSHFFLLLDFSVLITISCDEDVEEAGEDEVEELVDRTGTTKGTLFAVLQLTQLATSQLILLPFWVRCGS